MKSSCLQGCGLELPGVRPAPLERVTAVVVVHLAKTIAELVCYGHVECFAHL